MNRSSRSAGSGSAGAAPRAAPEPMAVGKRTLVEQACGPAPVPGRPGAGAPVQCRDAAGGGAGGPAVDPAAAAALGTSGTPDRLPHLDRIQSAFGRHDVGGIRAFVGGPAAAGAAQLGAEAFATGNDVAFRAPPDLHTAAHEAAHVVQQRAGVHLRGGLGRAGDAYEQHADQVADRVVAGASAEALLDRMAGGDRAAPAPAVQRKISVTKEGISYPSHAEASAGLRASKSKLSLAAELGAPTTAALLGFYLRQLDRGDEMFHNFASLEATLRDRLAQGPIASDVPQLDRDTLEFLLTRIASGHTTLREASKAPLRARLDALPAADVLAVFRALEAQGHAMAAVKGTVEGGTRAGGAAADLKVIPVLCFRMWDAADRVTQDIAAANETYRHHGIKIAPISVHVITRQEASAIAGEELDNSMYRLDEAGEAGHRRLTHVATDRIVRHFGYQSIITALWVNRVCRYDFDDGLEDTNGAAQPIDWSAEAARTVTVSTTHAAADTFAHEIGHMLLGATHNDSDPKNLMASGMRRNKEYQGNDRLDQNSVQTARASVFGWIT